MLVHQLVQMGVPGDRVDVGEAMAILGTPGLNGDTSVPSYPLRAFSEAVRLFEQEALAGSPATVVDIGAGYGLVALAAAARGYRVAAWEAAPQALAALRASVAHNPGFAGRVRVRPGAVRAATAQNASATGCLGDQSEALAHGYSLFHEAPECRGRVAVANVAQALAGVSGWAGLHLNAYDFTSALAARLLPRLLEAGRPPLLVEVSGRPGEAAGRGDWLDALTRAGYNQVRHWGRLCHGTLDLEARGIADKGTLGYARHPDEHGCLIYSGELAVTALKGSTEDRSATFVITAPPRAPVTAEHWAVASAEPQIPEPLAGANITIVHSEIVV